MNVRDKVKLILEHDPKSRSSDKRLLVVFMNKHGMNLSPEQIEAFYSMPSLESVRRDRQTLQSEGYFPASKKVQAEREAKAEAMKHGGFKNPDEVLDEHPNLGLWVQPAEPFPVAKPKYQPLPWDQS